MKKFRQVMIAIGTVLLGVAAAVASVFWFRQRRRTASAIAEELAKRNLNAAEEAATRSVKEAKQAAVDGWKQDQAKTLKKVQNEARSITPSELFDRLRGK